MQTKALEWVIEERLARWQRPGYPSDSPTREDVDSWIAKVKQDGVKSVICLLSKEQLMLYDGIELPGGGLLGYYQVQRLQKYSIPIEDRPGRTDHITDGHRAEAENAYQRAKKPVLVHCSAGQDRTGAIVEHLKRFTARTEGAV